MRWLSTVLLLASLPFRASAQTTWHVDGSGCDGSGTGSANDPFCTIQEAVDAAASGDTVVVSPGTYVEDVFIPGLELTLAGTSGALRTEIESAAGSAITLAPGSELRLDGFTLSGAGLRCNEANLQVRDCRFFDVVQYVGGGIWAVQSDVVVRACRFEDARAFDMGGGIYATGGTLRVEDCEFVGDPLHHSTFRGGAISLESAAAFVSRCSFADYGVEDSGSAIRVLGGRLGLERSNFQDNFVFDYGGTVAILDADAEIRACTFRDNESDLGWGGALYVSAGPTFAVDLTDCVFERNFAAEGGAVCVHAGNVTLEGCLFSGNSTAASYYQEHGDGGGLLVGGLGPPGAGFAHATRCVFLGNTAYGHAHLGDGRGGAVHGPVQLDSCTLFRNGAGGFFGDGPSGGAASGGAALLDCIVWNNQPDQLEPATVVKWSDVQGGWPGKGNLDLDPRFWDRQAGDLYLLPSSPCIDSGDPTQLDEDGSRIDMGAHPFDPRHGSLGRKTKG